MRTLTSLLVASLLGTSSLAFGAAPIPTTTREARMAVALKDYRAGTVATPQAVASGAPMVKKPHAARKARAVKKAHAGKHHVRAAGSAGAPAKAAPVPAK